MHLFLHFVFTFDQSWSEAQEVPRYGTTREEVAEGESQTLGCSSSYCQHVQTNKMSLWECRLWQEKKFPFTCALMYHNKDIDLLFPSYPPNNIACWFLLIGMASSLCHWIYFSFFLNLQSLVPQHPSLKTSPLLFLLSDPGQWADFKSHSTFRLWTYWFNMWKCSLN